MQFLVAHLLWQVSLHPIVFWSIFAHFAFFFHSVWPAASVALHARWYWQQNLENKSTVIMNCLLQSSYRYLLCRNAWPMDVPAYRVSHQLKDQKCTAVVVQFMVDGEQLVPWLMKPIDLFPKLTGHAMLICMFYFLRAWLTYNPSLIFFLSSIILDWHQVHGLQFCHLLTSIDYCGTKPLKTRGLGRKKNLWWGICMQEKHGSRIVFTAKINTNIYRERVLIFWLIWC